MCIIYMRVYVWGCVYTPRTRMVSRQMTAATDEVFVSGPTTCFLHSGNTPGASGGLGGRYIADYYQCTQSWGVTITVMLFYILKKINFNCCRNLMNLNAFLWIKLMRVLYPSQRQFGNCREQLSWLLSLLLPVLNSGCYGYLALYCRYQNQIIKFW